MWEISGLDDELKDPIDGEIATMPEARMDTNDRQIIVANIRIMLARQLLRVKTTLDQAAYSVDLATRLYECKSDFLLLNDDDVSVIRAVLDAVEWQAWIKAAIVNRIKNVADKQAKIEKPSKKIPKNVLDELA